MTYDNNGNLTQATDADNNTITWTYDALNRKTGEYDGTSDTAPPIATWTYDNSNDVSGVTDPIGQLTTESAYDKNGDAFTFQDKGFNVFGESLGETITVPSDQGALAGSYTLSHTYTATTGLPLKDTYPASPGGGSLPAETLTHTYIAGFDLPSGLGGLAAYAQDTTYTAWSQVAREEIGSTTANAYITNTYDANTGGLTDTQVANTAVSSTPYDDTSYSYDPSGNVTSETDTRSTAATGTQTEQQCFDYDTLDQLTQAWTSSSASTTACAAGPSTGTGGTVSDGIPGGAYWTKWAYDSLGNQASETDNSVTGGTSTVTNYTYNTNTASCGQQPDTLTSSSTTGGSTASASYTYDCDGNTTALNQSSGNQSLTWNPDGTLSTDTTTAGTTTYVYDAGGNLLAADNPGGDTLYIFGEQLTATSSGTVTGIRYIPLPGGGQAVRTGGGTSYYFQTSDLHGTSLLTLASNAQSPIWRQFTPYGAPRGTATGTWPGTNGYLGDPVNANDSLTTIGARQYTPATGRFLSPDPVLEAGDPAQMGGYAYAADNPATQSDPSGLNPEPTPGPGGGYGSGCTANPSAPGCNQPPPSGPGNPGAGGGTTGTGNAGGGCPSYDPGCPGFTGGGAGQGGELPVALAATPQPLQAVWAGIPGGCSGRLLWLGECGQEATDLVNLDRNDPSLSSPWQLLGMVGLAFTGVGDIADVADAIAAEDESDFVNLASDARTQHILDGHMPPGEPGNSLFPGDWSAAKIMNGVSEVATDPANEWIQQTGQAGAEFTRAGDPVRFAANGIYDGLKMRVIVEPGGEGIITGFPVP